MRLRSNGTQGIRRRTPGNGVCVCWMIEMIRPMQNSFLKRADISQRNGILISLPAAEEVWILRICIRKAGSAMRQNVSIPV